MALQTSALKKVCTMILPRKGLIPIGKMIREAILWLWNSSFLPGPSFGLAKSTGISLEHELVANTTTPSPGSWHL
jgi:hypothetical protein